MARSQWLPDKRADGHWDLTTPEVRDDWRGMVENFLRDMDRKERLARKGRWEPLARLWSLSDNMLLRVPEEHREGVRAKVDRIARKRFY